MRISDIAIKEVFCAKPDNSLSEIATLMRRHNVGVIPICEGPKLVGIITDRDMVVGCMAAGMDSTRCKAKEFMTINPVFVNPDIDIEETARIMGKEQVHRLPVVDNGKLVGLISLGDVSIALMKNSNLIAETLRRISMPRQVVSTC
jgi:CBS domain-containing protein